MSALLEQPRVGGMHVLQKNQCRKSLRDAAQMAQCHGTHVQQVAVPGGAGEQAVAVSQGSNKMPLLDSLLQLA
jgi:hypothetical protein